MRETAKSLYFNIDFSDITEKYFLIGLPSQNLNSQGMGHTLICSY